MSVHDASPELLARLAALSPAKRALLEQALRREESTAPPPAPVVPTIPRRVRHSPCLLSLDQERLWFIQQLNLKSPVYNVYSASRLRRPLDLRLLTAAMNAVVARHDILRTTFPAVDGRPMQVIAEHLEVYVPVVDLSGLAEPLREAEGERATARVVRRPFDLTRLPLFLIPLLRMDENDFIQPFVVHHLITDRISSDLIIAEFTALYEALAAGRPSPLPPPGVQFADFAVWQRARVDDPEQMKEQLAYWRKRLAGAPELLPLPIDRPRPAVASARGARRRFNLSPAQAAAFRAFAHAHEVTLFIAGLAALKALLVRLSGEERLIVGTPIDYRQMPELAGSIGFFLNQLVLFSDLTGNPTFTELLGRVRQGAVEAYDHYDLPFARLVEALRPNRDLGRTPFTQVIFLVISSARPVQPGQATGDQGSAVSYWTDAERAQVDVNFALFEERDSLSGLIEYSTDLFDATTIDRLKDQFRQLLDGALADPERRLWELPLLGEAEIQQLVVEWGRAREVVPWDGGSLHERFAAQAARRPQAVALVHDGETLSYGELDRRADRVAWRLWAEGVCGARVGLATERGFGMVIGILGILKAGCAYLPIDASQPPERLAFLLADSGAPVVLADPAALPLLPAWRGRTLPLAEAERSPVPDGGGAPAVSFGADAPAYVLYTSGSTGRPKGVVVTHGNVLRLFSATDRWFGFGERDVWTLYHAFTFDFSVWEVWGALLYGGRLVIVPRGMSRAPEAFLALLAEQRVTVLNQTPSAFRQLLPVATAAAAPPLPALRRVIFDGEILHTRSLLPWLGRFGDGSGSGPSGGGPALINMYGITETTVHVTYHPVRRAEVDGEGESGWGSRIGVAIPDLALYVLDPYGAPAPLGVAGEIAIGGPGLAQGYLGRPELTAARFVPDPFGGVPGARLYLSGDLGRWRSNGELEFVGRIDHQVKVRGFRIELGEIEAALGRHPQVKEAVAIVWPPPQAGEGTVDRRLVAYVVPRGEAPAARALRADLAAYLPEYMVPALFVFLAELPKTASGKPDRRALPAPGADRPDLSRPYVAPRTQVEKVLAAIWSEVLHVDPVGCDDNFFDLGGHSLLATQVLSRLQNTLLIELPIADVFAAPTLSGLAARADAALEVALSAGEFDEFLAGRLLDGEPT